MNFASGCGIFTSVSGTAPNRVFNIEWRTGYFGRPGTANFEVQLSESSTDINVVYGATVDDGLEETSGIQSSSSGPATQFSCGKPTLTDGLQVTYSCAAGPTPTPTATATPTCPAGGGAAGPWTAGNPYPTTIVRYGFAQTATHFYVFGGVDNGFATNTVNRMDLATGNWEPRAPMPFSGEAPTCALDESTGIVYCADGFASNAFAAYDIAADSWTPLASDPFADGSLRLRIGCFQWQGVCRGRLHFGGGSAPGRCV